MMNFVLKTRSFVSKPRNFVLKRGILHENDELCSIRPYMAQIFELILEYWEDPDLRVQILGLIEKLAVALGDFTLKTDSFVLKVMMFVLKMMIFVLKMMICVLQIGDEFKPYLSTLIPHMLSVLRSDRSERREGSCQVLQAFDVFGAYLDEHLHLVIPELVALFNFNDTKVEFRRNAIRTVGYLCCVANISDFTSRIVHPLVRVLDSTDGSVADADMDFGEVEHRRKEFGELRDDAMNTLCNLVYQVDFVLKMMDFVLKMMDLYYK